MNDPLDFERRVAAWITTEATGSASDQALHDIDIATSRVRPLPRWLALTKEPPMHISSRVAVGSPSARLASALLATLLMAVLATGAVVAGASLINEPNKVGGENGLIAFDSADGNIYVADPDGTNARVLVDRENELRGPSWSPDGTKLAFFEMVETGPGNLDDQALVHVVDADGANDVDVTEGQTIIPGLSSPLLMTASGLVWSPDSTQVAMTVLGDGSTDYTWTSGTGALPFSRTSILIAEADGSGVAPLPVEIDAADPMWSPDGEWLAWRGADGGAAILVSRPDGTGLRRLTAGSPDYHNLYSDDGAFSSPQWSPSGDRILYYSWDGSTYGTGDQDDFGLYVVGLDDGNPRLLADHPDDEWWPSWSPDGGSVAFQRRRLDETGQQPLDEPLELHVMAADGSDPRQLDTGPRMGSTGPVVWSPDGAFLLTTTASAEDADGRFSSRPTVVSLDPSVPPVVIADPGGALPEGFDRWPGISWQRQL